MTPQEGEALLRRYAAGDATWRELRRRGFDSSLDVLAGLGELGLRLPVAPLDGPNAESRRRGIELIRQAAAQAQRG